MWLQRFLYVAFITFRDFEKQMIRAESTDQQSVLKAVVMNIFNPGPYIFWTLVIGPILLKGWRETPVNGIGFLAGFYATLISSLAAIILVFGTAARLGPKVNRVLLGVSAIALFCFGLYQLWLGITGI